MRLIGYDSDYAYEQTISLLRPRVFVPKPVLKILFNRDKGICQLCFRPVKEIHATKDHIIPKSLGGGNGQDNLQLAHHWCNLIKGDSVRIRIPEYYIYHKSYGIMKQKRGVEFNFSRKYKIPKAALKD